MSDTLTDLNNALTALGSVTAQLATDGAKELQEAAALLTAAQASTGVDYTTQVTALNSMASSLQTLDTQMQAAIAAAKPVTGS